MADKDGSKSKRRNRKARKSFDGLQNPDSLLNATHANQPPNNPIAADDNAETEHQETEQQEAEQENADSTGDSVTLPLKKRLNKRIIFPDLSEKTTGPKTRSQSLSQASINIDQPNYYEEHFCAECGCSETKTPRMRRGPGGLATLCNSCGIKYQMKLKNRKK